MAEILIVNDDPATRSLMVELLRSLGHKITSAGSGLEALGHIYSKTFGVIILDIVLPQISGLGLLDIIRKRSPQTMVIMTAGEGDLESAVEALKKGAFDFVKKPIRMKELENVLTNALEEKHLMKSSGYVYKDCRREDRALIRGGITYAISDSLVVGLAFYLAFASLTLLSRESLLNLFIGTSEFLLISIGLAFCYAFAFVFNRSHRVDLLSSGAEMAGHLWKNISCAYLLHLAILFLVKDINFSATRLAIGIGYVLGFLGLLANRFLILPNLTSKFRREGKKNIVIVGSGKPAMRFTQQVKRHPAPRNVVGYIDKELTVRNGLDPNARVIATPEDADRLILSDDVEELYVAGNAFSVSEILKLMDRFKGRKMKIVVFNSLDEILHQADTTAIVGAQSR